VQITFQLPKADPDKQARLISEHWVQLKEPKSLPVAILLSVPFMLVGGFLTLMLTRIFVPVSLEDYGFQGGGISFNINILYILSIFVLLLIHELIHLSLIPSFMKSKHTGIGIQVFGGFVFTEEIMSRMRYLIVSLAPFVLISIVLPLLLGAMGYLNPLLIFLIILNALGSSVDLLNVVLVLSQVPKKAQIRNHGMNTFWK
jgi:hypothetical protein